MNIESGSHGNTTESLDISRRLEECALDMEATAIYLAFGGSNVSASQYRQWAADIRSIVIPQPVDEFVNQQCPKCGMIASNIFACGNCKDPMKIYGNPDVSTKS